MELKSCPFCGSNKLDVSCKTTTSSTGRVYHVVVFCKECRCYGPRVLSRECDLPQNKGKNKYDFARYTSPKKYKELATEAAQEAWNKRI